MIKTWNERCVGHPDHQTGITTERMIMRRMQEEIAELRDALEQRKPLTDELIDILARSMVKGNKSVNWLCRVIEAEHGIGGGGQP